MKVLSFICLLLVLAWSINIVATQYQNLDKLCFAKHGDFLQHPQDCSKFIRCSHNRAFEFHCANNLLWHHEIKTCDYSQRVKCTIKENFTITTKKTTKPFTITKFKREIKNNSYKPEDNTNKYAMKTQQKWSTVMKKSTVLPTSTTEIYTTSRHLPSTLSQKLIKITKNQKTICPGIKANNSVKVDLTKNHTKTTVDNVKAATENLTKKLTTPQIEEFTKSTNLFVNLTTETMVNLSTGKLVPTDQTKWTEIKKLTNPSVTEATTTNQVKFVETTNISANLTEESFINLTTTNKLESLTAELTNDQSKTSYEDLKTETIKLITDSGELTKTTELLVNSTVENIVNIAIDKFETTDSDELQNKTNNHTTAIELTTDYEKSNAITNFSVNFTTENLDNSTTVTFQNVLTNNLLTTKPEISMDQTLTTETIILLESENLVNLTDIFVNLTNIFVNLTTNSTKLTTNKLESSSTVELSTETTENLTTETLVDLPKTQTEFITNQMAMTGTLELSKRNSTSNETETENSINLTTISSSSTDDLMQFANTLKLPTNQTELLETTNYLINLTENIVNFEQITDQSETTHSFPNEALENLVTTSDFITDQYELANTRVISTNLDELKNFSTTKSESITEKLEFSSTAELTTTPADLAETTDNFIEPTTNLVNLTENSIKLTTDELSTNQFKITNTPMLNNDQTDSSSSLSTIVITENFENSKTTISEDIAKENLVNLANENFTTEKSLNLITEIVTDLLITKSSDISITEVTESFTTENYLQNLSQEDILTTIPVISTDQQRNLTENMKTTKSVSIIKDNYIISEIIDESVANETITTTGPEILTKYSATTNKISKDDIIHNLYDLVENPTLVPQKSRDQKNNSENPLELMSTTSSTILLDGSTTIDPRLPFRSPECQGENNRNQFMAAKCYQYYQCFAGWAFLLNCHDGWFFKIDSGACTRDVNNECEL